jgi:proteasome lid subunit RPN8/RPN11
MTTPPCIPSNEPPLGGFFFGRTTFRAFRSHALEAWPNEACGLLLRDGSYLRCGNVHPAPFGHFEVAPAVLLEHQGSIAAVLHSHCTEDMAALKPGRAPDCPSATDLRQQAAMGLPWGVVVSDGKTASDPFFWQEGDPPPLLGRTWRSGISDCYALVRDWCHLERGLALPLLAYDDGAEERLPALLAQAVQGLPVTPVATADLAPGDAVIAGKGGFPRHIGIYLGRGEWLHHQTARLSLREAIGPWLPYVMGGWRWKSA